MASTSRTRTGRGRGRGRGSGSGSSSLPPPPSTLPLIIEEFFIIVYEDPLVKKVRTPKKFADYLDGKEPAKVYLRAADCGPRLWTVEVLFDGQGRMYLDKGWEKFAIAHGVDFGWFVHFKYEGDDVLTVKVFDGTMCRRNPSKEIFSELDETFAQGPIFARSFQKTEEITKWGHEAARGVAGAAQALAAPTYLLGPSCGPPRLPSAYLKLPSRNPGAESHDTENLRRRRRESHLGGLEIASGTLPERGFISRRTLHRHGRLRSDE
ncbi:hypothetical protein QYE76_065509 [Lolium multiflorum]|uniref:TF-B3 domain-containing protein n=1 Tax=Lolium multiflorum TaxID=4521 RepID=A0AAD8WB35_LOLMU|nr:hypothetical protein QYE76_065509 [Lolium multiflorum]